MTSAARLAALATVVDDVLWPAAQTADQAAILPWSHFQALADLDLFGQAVPPAQGGLGFASPDIRRTLRLLGSGCGATGFAFAQHQGVAAALARTANEPLRRRWLGPVCHDTLAGIAFAHVRRPGPGPVRATRTGAGWRIDGEAPWVTSWGLATVFLVAAVTDDDQLLWFLLVDPLLADSTPADSPLADSTRSAVVAEPLGLMVYGATGTVRLRFDGLVAGDGDVVELDQRARWQVGDRRNAARPNPLCLGVGDRALRVLADTEPEVAAQLAPWWLEVGAAAEAAARAADDHHQDVAVIAAARTASVFAVQRLTTALLAAAGGRGAELSHPAQRLAREALFYVVQAQNADGRAATLAAVADAATSQVNR